MKLENQVCTLEQAKKLKELGVSQLSYFAYQGHMDYEPQLKSDDGNDYAAFTVAELGVMLPTGYDTMRVTITRDWERWQAYDDSDDVPFGRETTFSREAEARAAMLIYILELYAETVEEVNQRLTK